MMAEPPAYDAPHPAEMIPVGSVGSAPTPPHSLEAERECLGAVLVEHGAMDILAGVLAPEQLFAERHREIWRAMLELRSRGVGVDPVTLRQALIDRGSYERLGGARVIGELLDRSGSLGLLEHYAGIVRDKARLRRLIDAARAVEVSAYQDVHDVDAFVRHTETAIGRALGDVRATTEVDMRPIAEAHDPTWLTEAPAPRDALLTWGDWQRQPLMLPAGEVALLAAAGGVGKSYTLLDLAFAVATGMPWLRTYACPRKGKVLVAFAEEDLDELRRRLWALAKSIKGDDAEYLISEAARNIVPMALRGQDCAFLDRDRQPSQWHGSLLDRLSKTGPWRAIILDPLSRWGGPEIETDAHAATSVIRLLETLTQVDGRPAVVVAHHTNKSALNADTPRTQGVVRGHSALVDGARWVGFLERLPTVDPRIKGRCRLSVVKSNYGPAPDPLELVRDGTLRPMEQHELDCEREAREEGKQARRKGGI